MRGLVARGLVVAAVVAGVGLGVSGPAQAAAEDLTVSATRLVFEPGERGYTGTYHVTVTNTGVEPTYANVRIVEPVTGAFVGLRPNEACLTDWSGPGPNAHVCTVPGGQIAPGAARKFRVDLAVLTAPQAYAMSPADTTTTIVGPDSTLLATASSRTLFRSTTGVLTRPRPYVQDDFTDLSVAASDVTLAEQADGSFLGVLPVTVRWDGDAPHFDLVVETLVPEGFEFRGAGPDVMCGLVECVVPGGAFMQGESRTLELQIGAPAGTAAGTTGTGSVRGYENWFDDLPDADPSDDTASFRLTVG